MVDKEHPITPPPELVQQWREAPEFSALSPCVMVTVTNTKLQDIATQAAQWGADQELEACCHLLTKQGFDFVEDLRAARRPKPPSLKEQALQALNDAVKMADDTPPEGICSDQANIIRRALEQLDD